MGNFDKVIGYEKIKKELDMVVDMLRHREKYEKLGAKCPRGIMLYGLPGVGKTLLAESFIQATGLACYPIRKGDDIISIFKEAKENAPSIVFLDDMDKLADTDDMHENPKEFVEVQSAIESIKDMPVLILATVNGTKSIPKSLMRKGRFDIQIRVPAPSFKDAQKIIKHYLKDKPIAEDINLDDLVRMVNYHSCAGLEATLNEAAIYAAFSGRDKINIEDIKRTVLKDHFGGTEEVSDESALMQKERAYHEAGHVVVAETLKPGIVGMAAIGINRFECLGGFVLKVEGLEDKTMEVICALAGKAGAELKLGRCASGCSGDLDKAHSTIANDIMSNGLAGLNLLSGNCFDNSDGYKKELENAIGAEMNRLLRAAREIILDNEEFFEKAAQELLEKHALLYSDIQRIKASCKKENKTSSDEVA